MKRVIPIGDLLALYKRHPTAKYLLEPILTREVVEYSRRQWDGMGLLVRQNVTDAQWQATISIIRDLHKIKKCDFRMFEHRHGWRIVKDWTQAQMAIIETRMVRMEQVFLPYIVAPTGDTLYEFLAQRRFLLAAPDDSLGETVDGEVTE